MATLKDNLRKQLDKYQQKIEAIKTLLSLDEEDLKEIIGSTSSIYGYQDFDSESVVNEPLMFYSKPYPNGSGKKSISPSNTVLSILDLFPDGASKRDIKREYNIVNNLNPDSDDLYPQLTNALAYLSSNSLIENKERKWFKK